MLALCLILSMAHYAKNYVGIIGGSLMFALLIIYALKFNDRVHIAM